MRFRMEPRKPQTQILDDRIIVNAPGTDHPFFSYSNQKVEVANGVMVCRPTEEQGDEIGITALKDWNRQLSLFYINGRPISEILTERECANWILQDADNGIQFKDVASLKSFIIHFLLKDVQPPRANNNDDAKEMEARRVQLVNELATATLLHCHQGGIFFAAHARFKAQQDDPARRAELRSEFRGPHKVFLTSTASGFTCKEECVYDEYQPLKEGDFAGTWIKDGASKKLRAPALVITCSTSFGAQETYEGPKYGVDLASATVEVTIPRSQTSYSHASALGFGHQIKERGPLQKLWDVIASFLGLDKFNLHPAEKKTGGEDSVDYAQRPHHSP